MASAIDSIAGSNATTDPTKLIPTSTSQLATKDTFLKLLVAQIKNQDPTSPSDGVQFLTQLAQFSSLEQSMQTNTELASINQLLQNPTTAKSGGSQAQGNS